MDVLNEVTSPRLRALIELCQKEVPGFQIKYKDSSWWMRFLNVFARLFNKEFMTRYTTTTNSTVYVPTRDAFLADQEAYTDVLAHELVHMVERKKEGLVPNFLRYSFPQILAALALLSVFAIWEPWFLLSLLALLALVPLPAPGRKEIELNGYTMSMAVFWWRYGVLNDADFERWAKEFSGPRYYFMWPFHKSMLNVLKLRAQRIRTGEVLQDPLFKSVHTIYRTYG